MSKYVREIDSIEGLRNAPTSDAAAAHVRTPTAQGGVFVPMDADPFGNGDDGAVAIQASDGTWWVRKNALSNGYRPEWEGATANDPTVDNSAAIQSAHEKAINQNKPLVLTGGVYYVSSTVDLDVPARHTGIFCLGSVIRQTGGANLNPIVHVANGNSSPDSAPITKIAVDGNAPNNTGGRGVLIDFGTTFSAHIRASRCPDEGVRVEGNAESMQLNCEIENNGTGVSIGKDSNANTPDEVIVTLYGRRNGTDLEVNGNVTVSAKVATEATTAVPVRHKGGTVTLQGIIRGAGSGNAALKVTNQSGSNLNLGNLIIQGGEPAIDIDSANSIEGTVTVRRSVGRSLLVRNNVDKTFNLNITALNPVQSGTGIPVIEVGSNNQIFDAKLTAQVGTNNSGGDALSIAGATKCKFEIDRSDDSINVGGVRKSSIILTQVETNIKNAENASDLFVKFDRAVNDAQRANITTPVDGMVIPFNPDDGLPNYYNGTDWVLPDGTAT